MNFYKNILKQSLNITFTQTSLLALGIFLSSGFNLHWWYLLAWLKQNGIVNRITNQLIVENEVIFLFLFFLIFITCLLVFNLLKLWFYVKVHNSVHSLESQKCFLCKRSILKGNTVIKIITRRVVVWRTCLASLITVAFTTITLTGFSYYARNSQYTLVKFLIMLVSLIVVLIGVSLWNMVAVLFLFWYEQNFANATNLAIDLLFKKFKKIISFTIILTIIFLLAVSAGSLVISQLPTVFSVLPSIVSNSRLLQTSQTLISSLAALLFLGWLIINNVFFNVALLILFDNLINPEKSEQESNGLMIAVSKPSVSHQNVLYK